MLVLNKRSMSKQKSPILLRFIKPFIKMGSVVAMNLFGKQKHRQASYTENDFSDHLCIKIDLFSR